MENREKTVGKKPCRKPCIKTRLLLNTHRKFRNRSVSKKKWNGLSRTRSDRTGVTLSVGLKVKIYGIWMVGYIGITVTSPREPWVSLQ